MLYVNVDYWHGNHHSTDQNARYFCHEMTWPDYCFHTCGVDKRARVWTDQSFQSLCLMKNPIKKQSYSHNHRYTGKCTQISDP